MFLFPLITQNTQILFSALIIFNTAVILSAAKNPLPFSTAVERSNSKVVILAQAGILKPMHYGSHYKHRHPNPIAIGCSAVPNIQEREL